MITNNKPEELEVEKMLVLSTAHILPETREMLDETEEFPVVLIPREYGWLLNVPQADIETEDDLKKSLEDEIPADLLACITFAWKIGCEWLLLDSDGPVIAALTSYEER